MIASPFRVLYRDFLFRVLDIELLPAVDDIQRLLGQFAAMLAAFSFTLAAVGLPKYLMSTLSPAQLQMASRGECEFLIGATMTIAGLFSVLAWNNVLPSRRDCLVLGVLPVRSSTIFHAKAAAIATGLAVSVLAVNLFTGLMMPFAVANPGFTGALLSFGAYWLATTAAALFVTCCTVAMQGVAAHLLPYRAAMRVSGAMQFGAFFIVLGAFLLKPTFPQDAAGAIAVAHDWRMWIPSYWFFGLFEVLHGGAAPLFGVLAAHGLWALAIAAVLAAMTLGLAYSRLARQIVEQPDIAPSDRSRPAARAIQAIARLLLPCPIDRAILLFTARTIARSRQHRLLLAAYGGIGLAIALAYFRALLYGSGSFERFRMNEVWYRPNFPLMAGSMVLLFFAIAGARAVFALPANAAANWAWRITHVHSPRAYFSAVRTSLYTLAALPIWAATTIALVCIWPLWPALGHSAILACVAILSVERSLYNFRKVPFACSYLPGAANIHVRLGVFGIAFFAVTELGVTMEYAALQSFKWFAILCAILGAFAYRSRRRTTQWQAQLDNSVQFDEEAVKDVEPLNLHRDGGWPSGGSFIDSRPAGEPVLLRSFGFTQVERPPVSLRAWFEQLAKDAAYGVRILKRSPAFSAAAVAVIAIGIGGNTTVYSMIHGVLSKPAPGVDGEGLVSIAPAVQGRVIDPGENSFLNYAAFAGQVRTMKSLTAAQFSRFTLTLKDGTYELRGQTVMQNYFATLGVHLQMGRSFTADEARGAAPLTAVIADHVWRNQFHSAPDVLGQTVLLNGLSATIVGVGPPAYHGPFFAPSDEVTVPLVAYARLQGTLPQLNARGAAGIIMLGRLTPGVSLREAQAEFDTISRQLAELYPETNRGRLLVLKPYSATAYSPLSGTQPRLFMGLMFAVALLTLAIVVANVANLMLGRSVLRQREMAVRQSLGAGRARILRIVVFEGFTLSVLAAGASVLVANWVAHFSILLAPPLESGARLSPDLTPDWRVAAYSVLLAALTAVAFTVAPAMRTWSIDLLPWLKAGEQSVVRGRSKLAAALTVAQISCGLVLLTGAGLAWRSVSLIEHADLYFDKDHLLLAGVDTSAASLTREQNLQLLEHIRQRLAAIPGVAAASWAESAPPFRHLWMGADATAPGSAGKVSVDVASAGPDYMQTLGIPVLQGRGLAAGDATASVRAAVVTRQVAQALWPGESAVGRTLFLDDGRFAAQVAGVVPDGAFSGIARDGSFAAVGKGSRQPFIFVAEQAAQAAPGQRTFQIRYTGAAGSLATSVRTAIHDVDSRVPVFAVRTMEREWSDFTMPILLIARLVAVFAGCALLLAGTGLYAVVAFYTAGRRREFGIRMALGATPAQATASAMRDGLMLTGIGLLVGAALDAAVARGLSSVIAGVPATDPTSYAGALLVLGTVALLACYIPATRAARVHPAEALRQE